MNLDPSHLPIFLLVAEHEGPKSLWEVILHSNVLNFAIAVAFLGWVFKKFNLLGSIDTQQAKVAQEIKAAEAQKQKALEQLEAVKRQTANLSQEVESILATAKSSAESLSAQILENARHEASRIVETTKKRVELEQKAAAKALEARLLNDSLQEARETLTKKLTKKDQERSVEAFLEELPQFVNQS